MIKKILIIFFLLCSNAYAWDISADCWISLYLNDNAANSTVAGSCDGGGGVMEANGSEINTDTVDAVGKINGAISFNGATSKRIVDLTDSLDWAYNDPFTVEAWIKTTATGENTIIGNFDNVGNQNGWTFQTDGDDLCFIFSYDIGGGNWLYECTDGLGVNDGSWWHVFVTYSGSGTEAGTKFYASKTSTIAEFTSVTGSGSSITTDPTGEFNACVGARCSQDSTYAQEFTGDLDTIKVVDGVLDLTTIEGLHNGGSGTEDLSGGTGTTRRMITIQ